MDATSLYTSEERVQRLYCLVVLIEYAGLSLPFFYAFSSLVRSIHSSTYSHSHPSMGLGLGHSVTADSGLSANSQFSTKRTLSLGTGVVSGEQEDGDGRPDISFFSFVCAVLRVSDVYTTMRESTSELHEALMASGNDANVNALHSAAVAGPGGLGKGGDVHA